MIDTAAASKVGRTWLFTQGNDSHMGRGDRINATVTFAAIDLASTHRAFGSGVDYFDIRFQDGMIFTATAAELVLLEPSIEPPTIDSADDDDDEDDEDAACRTPDSDEFTDDGKGWNRYCGDCADRIECDRTASKAMTTSPGQRHRSAPMPPRSP